MKKIYPIRNPIEIRSYSPKDDIIDSELPPWIKEEMERVAKAENCSIRDLRYKRELFFDSNGLLPKWIDSGEIILEK